MKDEINEFYLLELNIIEEEVERTFLS